jgi:hypothetical protein
LTRTTQRFVAANYRLKGRQRPENRTDLTIAAKVDCPDWVSLVVDLLWVVEEGVTGKINRGVVIIVLSSFLFRISFVSRA